MPGIVVAGRRLGMSADGFVFISVVWAVVYAYLSVTFGVVSHAARQAGCESAIEDAALYGCLVVAVCSMLLSLFMVYHSSRGAVSEEDTKVRRFIPQLYIDSLLLVVAHTPFWGLASWLAFSSSTDFDACILRPGPPGEPAMRDATQVAIIVGWCLTAFRLLRAAWAFLWCQRVPPAEGQVVDEEAAELSAAAGSIPLHPHALPPSGIWACLLGTYLRCTCTERSPKRDLLDTIHSTFAGMDMTASDVLVAFKLVAPYHKHLREKLRSEGNWIPPTASGYKARPYGRQKARPLCGDEDVRLLETLLHYQQFSMAAYGWMLYSWNNLCTWPCRLCVLSGSSCTSSTSVSGDPCRCNLAAARGTLGIPRDDILIIHYNGDVCKPVYIVALDRLTRTVVISIRGTLSGKDIITDGLAKPIQVDIPGIGAAWVHDGFWQASQVIMQDLIDSGELERRCVAANCVDYSAVVVGHSMGAGVGGLLTCLMRHIPRWRDTTAWLYASPASMDLAAAQHCDPFITTALLGSDLIPRLTIRSIFELRHEMTWALRSSRSSKFRILCTGKEKVPWWENAPDPGKPPAQHDPEQQQAIHQAGRIIQWTKASERRHGISCKSKGNLRQQEVHMHGLCQKNLGPV